MKKSTEIRKRIRELKRIMKEQGIKRFSCFNGGHTEQSYRCNAELFSLATQLERAIQAERKPDGVDLLLPPLF